MPVKAWRTYNILNHLFWVILNYAHVLSASQIDYLLHQRHSSEAKTQRAGSINSYFLDCRESCRLLSCLLCIPMVIRLLKSSQILSTTRCSSKRCLHEATAIIRTPHYAFERNMEERNTTSTRIAGSQDVLYRTRRLTRATAVSSVSKPRTPATMVVRA